MNSIKQNIQWFPGHMTKTIRLMESEIKNVDIVIELLDARIPFSSKNPLFERVTRQKPRLILLNKSDLADNESTKEWTKYYKDNNYEVLSTVSKNKDTKRRVLETISQMPNETLENRRDKGMTGLKYRAMVIGIPNVGKSTFINLLADSGVTRVEDRPGVTRGKQWIVTSDIELLDMPGVLWPKFETQRIAHNLAFCGAISDKIVDMTELALSLLDEIKESHKEKICLRYNLEYDDITAFDLLEAIGQKRGMLISKGDIDIDRAAIMLIDELRGKKIGPITFEYVKNIEKYLDE